MIGHMSKQNWMFDVTRFTATHEKDNTHMGAKKSKKHTIIKEIRLERFLSVFLLCLFPIYAHAEVITFLNGDTMEGRVVAEDQRSITIDFDAGRMTFQKNTISSIRPSIHIETVTHTDDTPDHQGPEISPQEDGLSTFMPHNKEISLDQEKHDFIFSYFGSIKAFEDAFQKMKVQRDTHPDDLANRYQLGLAYYYLEDFDKALHELETVLEHDPNDIEAILYTGHAYYHKGDIKNAIHYLEKRVERRPSDYKSTQTLAFYYTHIRAFEKAIELFEAVLKRDPDDRLVAQNLLSLYKKVGDTVKEDAMKHKLEELFQKELKE